MMQVRIKRFESSPKGVAGALLVNDQFVCMTLERPWQGNTCNISCVPSGQYEVSAYKSSRHGQTYKVLDVPGRTGILFHKGNEIIHSSGCILLGQDIWPSEDKLFLANSSKGFGKFIKAVHRVPHFILRIDLV